MTLESGYKIKPDSINHVSSSFNLVDLVETFASPELAFDYA